MAAIETSEQAEAMKIDPNLKVQNAPEELMSPSKRPGVRQKVLTLQSELNKQNITLENQSNEIKRLHRMLDPLRLSLQRYTDQSESRIIKMQEKVITDQREKNNQLLDEIAEFKSWKTNCEGIIQSLESQIKTMTQQISHFNNELFGEETP